MINYGNIMHADQFRKVASNSANTRGASSTAVSKQNSSARLKTTISLRNNAGIVNNSPFYLMRVPPGESEVTGATNLLKLYGSDKSYNKLSRKVKEPLSSFLKSVPGNIDEPGHSDNTTLRSIIRNPPIVGKRLLPLTLMQLTGFRLHPEPLPDYYRYADTATTRKHKQEHKEHKHNDGNTTTMLQATSLMDTSLDKQKKRHKKHKRHEDDKERKKAKKEKKHKKHKRNQHSPEHSVRPFY